MTRPVASRRAILGAALAAPAILRGPLARAAARQSITIAEPLHSTGYLPMYVAVHKGFFEQNGLDTKIVTLDSNGAAHTNAVLSGQAFAFIGGPEHCAFAKAKGAELRAVCNVVDRGNNYFMARPGLAPAGGSVAELGAFLKGRRIATGFFGGTPNSITRYVILKKAGLALSDITLVESTSAGDLAAVRSGQAEIGVGTEPVVTQGIREKIWQEPFFNVPKILGPYAYSTLNIRLESLQKDPATVEAFVKSVMAGLRFTHEHPAEAAAIAKLEFPTMPEADMKATLDRSFADDLWSQDGSISQQSWNTAKEVVMAAGILKQDIAYDAIIDTRFVPKSA
jgi:NitT/TauT family transport system substrate-binding protein